MRGRRTITAAAGLIAAAVILPGAIASQAQAAGSVRSAVSLSGPAYGTYGARVALTGKLWRYGTSTVISGHPVVLQRSVHGRNVWGNLTSKVTSSTGTFAFGVTLNGSYDYRAVYAGSPTYTSAVSGKVFPAVKRQVFFDSIKTTDHGGDHGAGTLRVTGRVSPVLPTGTPVYLQRYSTSTKTWSTIGRSAAAGTSGVSVSAKVKGSVASYRLSVPALAPYYGNVSRSVGFAHYVWRGVYHKPVLGSGGSGDPWYRLIAPTQSNPYRSSAELGADRNGTSWVDVNTTGCVQLMHRGYNYTHQYVRTRIRVGVLANNALLRYVDLAPDQTQWMLGIQPRSSRTRVQVWDIGHTGEPLGWNVTWVLCNN
jgi:hypothetical protein